MRHWLLAAAPIALLATAAEAQVSRETVNRIADQAYQHGEVMETAAHLTDRIGGRLTNSPAMREAERWTAGKFREWGLSNVRADGFEFGRGWWIESSDVRMLTPRPLELRAIPVAWTPPTMGAVSGEIVIAPMSKRAHFEAWKGKLAGKIVLVSLPGDPRDLTDVPFKRLTDAEISKRDEYAPAKFDPEAEDRGFERTTFARDLDAFLKAEGAVAWARMSYRDGGLVHGTGYLHKAGQTARLPGVEIAQEDYRRLARLAKSGPVTLQIDSRVHFDDSDTQAYNILADIPGRDPKAGYVMAGAHLDSWVAADGAADNASGSAVVMEAARILAALGVKPKRTIRFALWSGEEQGLWGSAAYVEKYLARRPANTDPERAAWSPSYNMSTFPITPLSGFKDMTAYFNIDNGSGRIRGIHAEHNLAAIPTLKEWLSPLGPFDATRVVAGSTSGTDHVYMARLGLPAFQFVQDPLDYSSRTHHTSIDTFDRLRPDDLRQAAVVLATVLLQAAETDKPLPPNTLPTPPKDSDPFDYPDPDQD